MNKKRMTLTLRALVMVLGMFAWANLSFAITLSIDPSSQTINTGESVEVGIQISDLGDLASDSLSAYDFEISFDATVLKFSSVTFGHSLFGNQLDLFNLGGNITNVIVGSGIVEVSEISLDDPFDLDSLQSGSFQLATIAFTSVGRGSTALDLSIIDFGDAFGDPLIVTNTNGRVTVVPLPAAVYLFGSGLLGLIRLYQHRQDKLVL